MNAPEIHDETTRAADAVAYVSRLGGGTCTPDTLIAVCYLADRLSLSRHGHPMFGSVYALGPSGPENPVVAEIVRSGRTGMRGGEDLDELSRAVEDCLKEAFAVLGRLDVEGLSAWRSEPGNMPEWKAGDEAPSLERIMEAAGVRDPEEQAAFVRDMDELHRMMTGLSSPT